MRALEICASVPVLNEQKLKSQWVRVVLVASMMAMGWKVFFSFVFCCFFRCCCCCCFFPVLEPTPWPWPTPDVWNGFVPAAGAAAAGAEGAGAAAYTWTPPPPEMSMVARAECSMGF